MAPRSDSRKARVLVIDDDQHVADSVAMILSAHGYEVTTEYSGKRGIQRASEFHPEIVICDVLMPGLDGLETAMQIQQQHHDCRIMLFSAVPEHVRELQQDRGTSQKFEVLAKPLSPRSLLESLALAGGD